MNKAPLIIAGVAVLAVASYMVYMQNAEKQTPMEKAYNRCMMWAEATPEDCYKRAQDSIKYQNMVKGK